MYCIKNYGIYQIHEDKIFKKCLVIAQQRYVLLQDSIFHNISIHAGLCNPEKKLLELHQRESCSKSPTQASDDQHACSFSFLPKASKLRRYFQRNACSYKVLLLLNFILSVLSFMLQFGKKKNKILHDTSQTLIFSGGGVVECGKTVSHQ